MADAVDAGPIDVLIGVRNPASFLVSAYGQALMGGHQISFDAYFRMTRWARFIGPDWSHGCVAFQMSGGSPSGDSRNTVGGAIKFVRR